MISKVKDPKPEIMRLEELALSVKAGEIKLPRFQRPFVWKEPDMLKLLDSIYKGYPIGSILIWNSSQKLNSERSILGLEVNIEENSYYPTNYLLDGQQRLTTLCGALFWAGNDPSSIWNIHFDLDTQEFLYPKQMNLVTHFPLNKLIKTSDFIKQCMKFDHHDKREEYYKISERLLKSIKDYKIAVVKIGDMTIDEVAPIFERINSTGRKLTIVDLMMAATWSNGFDLTSEIHSIKEYCKQLGFDRLSDTIILRSISASANLGINKDDIQKLRSKNATELCDAANAARDSLGRTLLFLREHIGIHDIGYLPYNLQLTYLAEFFRFDTEPSPAKLEGLVQWFWYTSVTRYFASGANTGQVSKDLNSIRAFASGNINYLFDRKEIDITKLLFDRFVLRNATSITFTVLLNSMKPSSTLDNKSIDDSHLKIKASKFYTSFSPNDNEIVPLNISKVIYPYLENLLTSKADINNNDLYNHLLDVDCVKSALENDVYKYLQARSNIIAARVEELTGCDATFSIPTFSANHQVVGTDTEEEYNGEENDDEF